MNDPRRPERFGPTLPGSEPTGPQGSWHQQPGYQPPADPAYADQAPYAPTYRAHIPYWAPSLNDTQQLPPYWQQGIGMPAPDEPPSQSPAPAPPPGGPKSPRWLWLAAGVAVFLAVALVIALALANDAIKKQTAVPPLAPMPETSSEFPTPPPSTRASPPRTHTPAPPPSGSQTPTETTAPAALQDVVYTVTGEGRALSIMYIATGDVVQTEFNVALPWTKEVRLAKSAVHPAAVTIVNFGYNVTCSVTVAGVQVSRRVGAGLTICDARG